MSKNDLRQRVADRLEVLGLGPVEAAERVPGLERNFIRDLISGKKAGFSQSKAPLVAQALDWTATELLAVVPNAAKRDSAVRARLAQVPLLDSVTAGRLAAPMSQIPVERVPLLAFADLGRGEFFALRVEGTSMDRQSPEGSIIVVNRADKTLISGKSYVFNFQGETTYKLWQGGDPPYLAPFTTEPIHKPIFVKKKRDMEVIGRVKRTVLDL